jgi:hypothetical protein
MSNISVTWIAWCPWGLTMRATAEGQSCDTFRIYKFPKLYCFKGSAMYCTYVILDFLKKTSHGVRCISGANGYCGVRAITCVVTLEPGRTTSSRKFRPAANFVQPHISSSHTRRLAANFVQPHPSSSRKFRPATHFVQPHILSSHTFRPAANFVQPHPSSSRKFCPATHFVQPHISSSHTFRLATHFVQPHISSSRTRLLLWRG